MTVDTSSNEKLEKISSFRRILPQVLASSAKNLLLFDLGLAVAFPTIVIPALRGLKEHDNNDILSLTAGVSQIDIQIYFYDFIIDLFFLLNSKHRGLQALHLSFSQLAALRVGLSLNL
jgi:hypothetical protein